MNGKCVLDGGPARLFNVISYPVPGKEEQNVQRPS